MTFSWNYSQIQTCGIMRVCTDQVRMTGDAYFFYTRCEKWQEKKNKTSDLGKFLKEKSFNISVYPLLTLINKTPTMNKGINYYIKNVFKL